MQPARRRPRGPESRARAAEGIALFGDADDVTARVYAPVRKELVRPDRPSLADEEAFRFRHVLMRDAA